MDEQVDIPNRTDEPVQPRGPVPRPDIASRPAARSRRRRGSIIGLLGLLLVALLIWRHPWSAGGAHRGAPAMPPQAVGIGTVTRADVPITDVGLGTVTPLVTDTVQTQINGQLMSVGYQEGQIVKKGDFLVQIDPRPYQALLAQYEGALAHDQGLLKQAQADYLRYQQLNRQDSISRQQVEDQFFLIKQYQGSVQSDQAEIDAQKLNLIYCHITAPISGRVGLRLVDPGNYVQTGTSTGLVVLTQLQPISVIFPLPEDALDDIIQRLRQGAVLPVTLFDRTNTTQLAVGQLVSIDNQIDTTTGTVKLRADFANSDYGLFPNQFVNARLLVDTLRQAVVVPNAAVQTGTPGTFVYLVNPDDTVSVRVIKTGPADAEHTAVLSGLAVGDKVVVDGVDRLRDGARVVIPAAHAGASGDGAGAAPAGSGTGHAHRHHRTEQPDGGG